MPDAAEANPVKLQLLGLAFAGADLVFTVAHGGRVAFALGAAEQLCGRSGVDVIGMDWLEMFEPEDGELLSTLLHGVKPGERQGPLGVTLRRRPDERLRRQASLSVFRLPQLDGALSCALTLGGPQRLDGVERNADGLLDARYFERVTAQLIEEAQQAGLPLQLDLVELQGLDAAIQTMGGEDRDRTRRQVAATLRAQSLGGVGATEVSADRFAMVSDGGTGMEALSARLTEITGETVQFRMVALPLEAGSPAQNLRAMRYALDRYIEDGAAAASTSFLAKVKQTVHETSRFKSMLSSGGFHVAYQPIVALSDGSAHHFEALARFDADASTADTIRLAEELGLIAEFDMSLLGNVAEVLRASDPKVRIAANVSGRTLLLPGFVEALARITAGSPDIRTRLLIEITETQKLADLEHAGRVIKALRTAGHIVCLDDFGVGSASLDYLRQLDVDIVKLDGSLVKGVGGSAKDMLIARHVVSLCRDLKVRTIVEMVETKLVADLMRAAGADFGQGWYFGKPQPKPDFPPLAAPLAAVASPTIVAPRRRAGAVEQWG